jgi:primosomal protein N''
MQQDRKTIQEPKRDRRSFLAFPASRHTDQIDAFSQALIALSMRRWDPAYLPMR